MADVRNGELTQGESDSEDERDDDDAPDGACAFCCDDDYKAADAEAIRRYVGARQRLRQSWEDVVASEAATRVGPDGAPQKALCEGTYTVKVHVIQARELNGENFDGTSDPFVEARRARSRWPVSRLRSLCHVSRLVLSYV